MILLNGFKKKIPKVIEKPDQKPDEKPDQKPDEKPDQKPDENITTDPTNYNNEDDNQTGSTIFPIPSIKITGFHGPILPQIEFTVTISIYSVSAKELTVQFSLTKEISLDSLTLFGELFLDLKLTLQTSLL